ncbi:MAG: beta-propeller fold lactonase family protein [Caldilineaceae bacterium]
MTQPTTRRTVLLVSLTGDEAIKLYDLDSITGALTLRTVSPAHGPSGTLWLHPNHKVLYDAHVESSTLAAFTFDATSGEIALINKVETGIETPAHLITDHNGRFLLTAYYTGGGITVHRLGADGAIGELVQTINSGEKAHAVLSAVEDRFIFVPHVCPVNKTSQFRFDAVTGKLTPNDPTEVVPPEEYTGPRHACIGPKGDVVYIVNEQGNSVTAHRFDREQGILTPFQTVSTLPAHYSEGGYTAHIEVHPNGKWLYASNRGHDSIVGFNLASDGSIQPFGYYPVPASPRSFNIDPTGNYLYCAGEAADTMTAYRVDPSSGALQPIADYAVGKSPFWVMSLTI